MRDEEILADLKRFKDDIAVIESLVYVAISGADAGRDLSFDLTQMDARLDKLDEVWKRITRRFEEVLKNG